MLFGCVICLKNDEIYRNLNQIDQNNIPIIIKLRQCVPEVEWQLDSQICSVCSEQLENVYKFHQLCIKSDLLRKNNQIEQLQENFICYHCNENFQLKHNLIEHIDKKHRLLDNQQQQQQQEQQQISDNVDKKVDKSREVVENPSRLENICDICGARFTNKYLLKRHQNNVHVTEKRYKCDLCERKFASLVYLNAHKRYHIGERKHICTYCGKGYITTSDLSHHEKIHLNQRSYRCDQCTKSFNTSSDLYKHKICVHLDRTKWKYICDYCQRSFPLKTNLDTHRKIHTGERNFVCHLCNRKCINRSVLKRHIESHTIVKSYKCNHCLHCYKYQKSLDVHLAKIHGIGNVKIAERVKKFVCNLCSKSYFSNCKLEKHKHTQHPIP